jgi:hypothetical protein
MPFVANPRKAATDLVGKRLAELARPLSDGFVADDDAAGRQQLLHHAQPERKAEIQPHGMADDLGREPIPGIAGARRCPHPTRLLTPICSRKRDKARQVDGAAWLPEMLLFERAYQAPLQEVVGFGGISGQGASVKCNRGISRSKSRPNSFI